MPYADREKQKAYVRAWAREYQRRKKAEIVALVGLWTRSIEKTDKGEIKVKDPQLLMKLEEQFNKVQGLETTAVEISVGPSMLSVPKDYLIQLTRKMISQQQEIAGLTQAYEDLKSRRWKQSQHVMVRDEHGKTGKTRS